MSVRHNLPSQLSWGYRGTVVVFARNLIYTSNMLFAQSSFPIAAALLLVVQMGIVVLGVRPIAG